MVNIATVFVIFSTIVFQQSLGYPGGAPTSQCSAMTPSHGVSAQTGPSPYEVKVEKPYYMPGKNVRVSIQSSGDNVKGFLIQARKVGETSATGMFGTLPTNVKYLACGNNKGAATHSARLSVKTLNFEWEPPSGLSGNISFLATVVKDKATFWVKLESPELYKMEMPSRSTQQSSSVQAFTLPQPTRPEIVESTDSTIGLAIKSMMAPTKSMMAPTKSMMASTKSMMAPTKSMMAPTKSMLAPTSMRYSTSTPTSNNTCNPTCEGSHLPNNVALLFFLGLLLVLWQNAI